MAPISLILLHGRSWPKAVAIAGERIIATGDNAEIATLAEPGTQVIDCSGLTISAGFVDAHCHVLAAATSASGVDCAAGSIDELVATLKAHAAATAPGEWLRGRGYHEATLAERRHPTRHDLDRAAPDHPVRIIHVSGHASALNSAALARFGIDAGTEEPPGGAIERDVATGEPSGVLIEMEDWLDARMPPRSAGELERDVGRLSAHLLAAGVTSVQDLGHRNDRRRAELLAELAARGVFRPRITMATGYEAFAAGEDAVAPGIGRGPVKIMLNEAGKTLQPDAFTLTRIVGEVHQRGRQVAIHAVQPPAIAAAIHAIARAQAADGQARRHRIEHVSIAPPPVVERMAALGIVPVSNPGFIYAHGDRYMESVAPADLPFLYDVAGIVRRGRRVAAGSDAPVGPIEPAAAIRAAARRRSRSGRRLPGPRLSVTWGLLMYTLGGAFAAFEEQEKGLIAPGMLADIVLLDVQRDLVRPVMTILGGRPVWQAPEHDRPPALQGVEVHAG